MNNQKPKAKVYIDGANIFYTQKKLGWSIDWMKAKKIIEENRTIIEWRYYVALKDEDEKMRGYIRYLNNIGFTTLTKPLKKIHITGGDGTAQTSRPFIYKANFDVEMTADILLDKASIQEVVLFSGDSDFEYLIRKLKDSGINVVVFASRKTISWELKLAATRINYFERIEEELKRI